MKNVKLAAVAVGTSATLSIAALAVGTGSASADGFTIDAASFVVELCGDNAYATAEEDGVEVTIIFSDGAGPFGGGSYNCATGELTI